MIVGVDYDIGPALPSELPLVLDSWRKSLRKHARMATSAYHPWFDAISADTLARFPLLLTARCDGVSYGWICAEWDHRGVCVQYVYVKSPRRQRGIARELLRAVLADLGPDAGPGRYYRHSTHMDEVAHMMGFEHIKRWV